MKAKSGRAKMPWNGDIVHTKLSDGSVALRGSREEAVDRYGEELVKSVEMKGKSVGIAMDEYEARECGENPGLDESTLGHGLDRTVRIDSHTTVLAPKTVNGRATIMLSCRCGATTFVPLVVRENGQGREEIVLDVPEDWYADVDYPHGRQPDERYIVRCPEHRGALFGHMLRPVDPTTHREQGVPVQLLELGMDEPSEMVSHE